MRLILLLVVLLSPYAFSGETKFPYGNGLDKWGVPLKIPESEISLRLGARLQSLMTIKTEKEQGKSTTTTSQDFQARRVRFQFEAYLPHNILFNMDIRNDNANQNDSGERGFNIGDAYAQIPVMGSMSHFLRLYRAKVDVSRTQTASSSELIFLNRPYVADEAAQFVNHNRRASNIQFVGNFYKKVSYQLALGDGVFSERFNDAKGEAIDNIDKQNFMLGGKLRFHPFTGWEDLKSTETYMGEGKHFSFGVGFFNTSNIFIENQTTNLSDKVSRNLTNFELSAHYQEWSFFSEYFIFDGVIEDHGAASFNVGKSEGWYAQAEKLFSNFYYIAPFVRYESWNRFIDTGDYLSLSQLYGVNWYANGNRFKLSLAYEHGSNGRDTGIAQESDAYHFATAWHF